MTADDVYAEAGRRAGEVFRKAFNAAVAERRAPQKQCKQRAPHGAHHYEQPDGLVCYCQGRSRP